MEKTKFKELYEWLKEHNSYTLENAQELFKMIKDITPLVDSIIVTGEEAIRTNMLMLKSDINEFNRNAHFMTEDRPYIPLTNEDLSPSYLYGRYRDGFIISLNLLLMPGL